MTGYIFEEGAFGMYDNYKWDFQNMTKTSDAQWDIGAQEMPLLGARPMIYFEKGKADASGLMTNTSTWKMTTVEKYGIVHRYAVLTPYNSNISTNKSTVWKVIGATS